MFNSILGPHDAGSTPAVMLIKNASCGTKSLLIENHRSGEIGASKNSWEPGLSVRTQIKAVSQDMKEKTIANRFQSWNPLDSVSKCRGVREEPEITECESLDDWEVVPPLTTREHRKGCTAGRRNGEFDSGSIVFGILAECLYEQSGTWKCRNGAWERAQAPRFPTDLEILSLQVKAMR